MKLSTKNNIKVKVTQTGQKSMIRLKNEEKATMRQGYSVWADNERLASGTWEQTEVEVLIEAIKRERYAHLAYKELYYNLLNKLSSIGLILKSEDNDDAF